MSTDGFFKDLHQQPQKVVCVFAHGEVGVYVNKNIIFKLQCTLLFNHVHASVSRGCIKL